MPKGVEVDIDETEDRGWGRGWGDDFHAKRVPLVITRQGYAGGAPEHELPSSFDPIAFLPRLRARGKARTGQQHQGRKGHALKRYLVLGVGHQEGSAHSRILQESAPHVRCGFLEEDDIRRFRSIEDLVEDEFGTYDGPRGEGVDVP